MLTLSAQTMASGIPTADIAILLDTSGSMQGLINQVRDGLWQTLNNLGELKRDGEKARLRLSLYEYGSGSVSAEANFLQQLSPLTTDHTKIAEKLFATKATGSQEYSGTAISMASHDLKWTADSLDFKSIVIAGNETIHQGPIKPLQAAIDAFNKHIIVNSIFAGPQTITRGGFGGGFGGHGCAFCPPNPNPNPTPSPDPVKNPIFVEWELLAQAGGGETLNIDHNNAIPYVKSPFDERIVEITKEINETFLPFGKNGRDEYDRMLDLDGRIRNSGAGSYMDWGSYRGGNFGSATIAKWDLVTAMEDENFDLSAIPESELPEQLRGLSMKDKKAFIKKFADKRKVLEEEARDLREQRRVFVENELRDRQGQDQQSFADALKAIIVKQLQDKGFELK